MKRVIGKGVLAAVVFTLLANYSPLTMATVVYNFGSDGKVTDVTGIAIDGYTGTYKVEFIDGTFNELFTGDNQPFYWQGYEDMSASDFASSATSALKDDIFAGTNNETDWSSKVDNQPWNLAGLSVNDDLVVWFISTPYKTITDCVQTACTTNAWFETFINHISEEEDRIQETYNPPTFSTEPIINMVYARWTPEESGAVPEPTTVALLAIGALGLSVSARRRRSELPQ